MFTCQDIKRFVDPFVDGEFDAFECAEVEVHLEQCEECRQLIEFRLQMKELIRKSMSAPAPSSLHNKIFAALDAVEVPSLDAVSEPSFVRFPDIEATSPLEILNSQQPRDEKTTTDVTPIEKNHSVESSFHDDVVDEDHSDLQDQVVALDKIREARETLAAYKKTEQRKQVFRYGIAAAAIAAIALFIAVVPQWTVAPATTEGLSVWEESVDWHRTDIPMEVKGPNPTQVSNWFHGKVNFEVDPLSFGKDVNAELVGGRLASVHNRRAALLDYKVNGTEVTVLVFDGKGVTVPSDKLQTINNQPIAIIGGPGYDVALFHKNDLTYTITADLPSVKFEHLIHKVLSSN